MARTFAILIAGAVIVIAVSAMATTRGRDSLYFDAPVTAPAQTASIQNGAA